MRAFIVLLLFVALFFALRLFVGPQSRSVPFGAGRLHLTATTFGTNHTYVAGTLLQRLAAPWASSNLSARLGIKRLQLRPSPPYRTNETLVAWIEAPAASNILVRIADSHGHEQSPAHANAFRANLPNGQAISSHVFSSFPRQSKSFSVRVYSQRQSSLSLLAEFRVHNPISRTYPSWSPEPLPLLRRTNDIEFRVTKVDTGLHASGAMSAYAGNWTEIEYQYGPPDFPTGPWQPLLVEASDATGNRIQIRNPWQRLAAQGTPLANHPDFSLSRRRGVLSLPVMLWPDSPAWKIHVELARLPASGFRSNEIWEVADVPVPALDNSIDPTESTDRFGKTIRFRKLSVSDAGNRPYPNLIAQAEVDAENGSKAQIILASVTDQRGTNIAIGPQANASSHARFHLHPLPPESRRLNFRFAIHTPISLDFIATPRVVNADIIKSEE